jgi:hypothetical protein
LNKVSLFMRGWPGLWSFYLHFPHSWDDRMPSFYWLTWGCHKIFAQVTLNCSLPNYCLHSSFNYRPQPLCLTQIISFLIFWLYWGLNCLRLVRQVFYLLSSPIPPHSSII